MHDGTRPKLRILAAAIYASALLARLGGFDTPVSEWGPPETVLTVGYFAAAYFTAWFTIAGLVLLDNALIRSETVELPAMAIGIFSGAVLLLMLPFIIGQVWPAAGGIIACAAGLAALEGWRRKTITTQAPQQKSILS